MTKKNGVGWRDAYRRLSISSRLLILFLFTGIGFCIFLILFFVIPLYSNLDKASGSISFLDATKQVKKEILLDSCFIEGHFDQNSPRIVLKGKQGSMDAVLSFVKSVDSATDASRILYTSARVDMRTYSAPLEYAWRRPDDLSLKNCTFEELAVSAQRGFSTSKSTRSLWNWLVNGSVRVLCELPEKEFVSLEAAFKNCASNPSVAF